MCIYIYVCTQILVIYIYIYVNKYTVQSYGSCGPQVGPLLRMAHGVLTLADSRAAPADAVCTCHDTVYKL